MRVEYFWYFWIVGEVFFYVGLVIFVLKILSVYNRLVEYVLIFFLRKVGDFEMV